MTAANGNRIGRRDPRSVLDDIDLPGSGDDRRVLLEEFRPVAQALEVRLSDAMWELHGPRAFIEGEVPFIVNNSGWGPAAAARVLFANCTDGADSRRSIVALELGAGVGLFARQLLDAFRALCVERGKDYYDRLIYYVTDRSPRTLGVWRDTGVFEDHAGRVTIASCDASRPLDLFDDGGRPISLPAPHAVFCNYILDSLPGAIVRGEVQHPQQLHVRTWLRAGHAGPSAQEAAQIARASDARELLRLLPASAWFEFETDFREEGAASLPHVRELIEFQGSPASTILNHGAIACLRTVLAALDTGGFVLVNDFGPVEVRQAGCVASPIRFGQSVSLPLNFAFLEQQVASLGARVFRADGDHDRSIHSRLLVPQPLGETERVFLAVHGDPAFIELAGLPATATEHIRAQRPADALECFRQGLRSGTDDWNLLTHAAQFLNQQLLRHEDALVLACRAAELNPWFSSFVWNTLGNCRFCLGDHDGAHRDYLRAREISEVDPQTHLNLAYSFGQQGRHRDALESIGRALRHDADGRFRASLLDKQRLILEQLDAESALRIAAEQHRNAAFKPRE